MAKTKFYSYANKGICKGCKFCVKGQKLVLFIGGKCSRNCWYCSLSKNRKNSPQAYANERPIKNSRDLIKEAKQSNAKGAGITGGDPLVYFKRTIKYARTLKKKYASSKRGTPSGASSDFHIHIYLPLNLVTEKKLKKLNKYIDEVRFHPTFLIDTSKYNEEIEKIKAASRIFGKQNTGIELPMMPTKKKEIYQIIKDLEEYIGFCNLNELEISETNFDIITKKHSLNGDTFTVRESVTAGKSIIRKAEKEKLKTKIHLCTAKTKDCVQYINRLLNHKILPYGNRTDEGTVVYFCVYYKTKQKDFQIHKFLEKGKTKRAGFSENQKLSGNLESENPPTLRNIKKQIKKLTNKFYIDKNNKRVILAMNEVEKIHNNTNLKIERLEEHPTFNSEYLERSTIGE